MPKIRVLPSETNYSRNNRFSISVRHLPSSTEITLHVHGEALDTGHYPHTSLVLEQFLPSIFSSKCFNGNNYPFKDEVKRTEIGHLFEHILLEYLSDIKYHNGTYTGVHTGVTKWNWRKDVRGIFYISIDAGINDAVSFNQALNNTIKLMSTILKQGNTMASFSLPSINYPFPIN